MNQNPFKYNDVRVNVLAFFTAKVEKITSNSFLKKKSDLRCFYYLKVSDMRIPCKY
jgi:hypothetical protein